MLVELVLNAVTFVGGTLGAEEQKLRYVLQLKKIWIAVRLTGANTGIYYNEGFCKIQPLRNFNTHITTPLLQIELVLDWARACMIESHRFLWNCDLIQGVWLAWKDPV